MNKTCGLGKSVSRNVTEKCHSSVAMAPARDSGPFLVGTEAGGRAFLWHVFISSRSQRRSAKAGYIADSVAITRAFLASSLHRPVVSRRGHAGSGKTRLAYVVAQAANTGVERLQCYQGIGEDKAIGKFDESLQMLCVEQPRGE